LNCPIRKIFSLRVQLDEGNQKTTCQINAMIIRADNQSNVPIQPMVATRPTPITAGGHILARVALAASAFAVKAESRGKSRRSMGSHAILIVLAP
jgi:hypothetical protein